MARLSVLKLDHSERLPVGYQHHRQLMSGKFFLIFFVLKNWLILHYLKVGCKCVLEVLWWRFMLTIHAEVQDFGDEDETIYKTDEINKENMNDFWIFIADQKSEKSLTGIEPVTWSPVRCSNYWATQTKMVSEGYIYILLRKVVDIFTANLQVSICLLF